MSFLFWHFKGQLYIIKYLNLTCICYYYILIILAIILEACLYFHPMLVVFRNNLWALTLLRVPSGRWLMYYDIQAPFFVMYARKFNHLFLYSNHEHSFCFFFLKVHHCSHGLLSIIQITTVLLPHVSSSHVRKLFSIHCQELYYTDDEEIPLFLMKFYSFLIFCLDLRRHFY